MKSNYSTRLKVRLGALAHRLPMRLIPGIGRIYCGYQRDRKSYEASSDRKEWIYQKVYNIVKYALNNIPFYQKFYAEHGFELGMLRSFEDIVKIPVVTKQDLMTVNIEQRSAKIRGRYVANTGGSTGVPFSFYKVYALKIKEMAFFHYAWRKLGYKRGKIILHFVGRQVSTEYKYELARNEIRFSADASFKDVLQTLTSFKVEFLKGYPSVLYEFALYCEKHSAEFRNSLITKHLKGIMLNSEYPHPLYREKIQQIFGVPTLAWYGHTEVCVLGFDYGDNNYHIQQAYGYAEYVESEDGKHLIGTCYDNYASPLIRYDTNDLMDKVTLEDGILSSFRMTNGGRNGQYIEDANGKHISLTWLIFGKHHQLFNYCSQIQISQEEEKNKATIYYVPKGELPRDFDPSEYFDKEGVDIEFEFKQITEPIRTKNGKVLLKVPSIK